MAAHGFGVDVDGGSSGQLFSSSLNQPVNNLVILSVMPCESAHTGSSVAAMTSGS